jgi:hypothetical protein
MRSATECAGDDSLPVISLLEAATTCETRRQAPGRGSSNGRSAHGRRGRQRGQSGELKPRAVKRTIHHPHRLRGNRGASARAGYGIWVRVRLEC